MPDVLEIEQVQVKHYGNKSPMVASWLTNIPTEVIEELGLAKGSRIALTINDGDVSGDVLPPSSPKLNAISNRLLEKNRKVYEELKRLGV